MAGGGCSGPDGKGTRCRMIRWPSGMGSNSYELAETLMGIIESGHGSAIAAFAVRVIVAGQPGKPGLEDGSYIQEGSLGTVPASSVPRLLPLMLTLCFSLVQLCLDGFAQPVFEVAFQQAPAQVACRDL